VSEEWTARGAQHRVLPTVVVNLSVGSLEDGAPLSLDVARQRNR
jgi:hypothetical protein